MEKSASADEDLLGLTSEPPPGGCRGEFKAEKSERAALLQVKTPPWRGQPPAPPLTVRGNREVTPERLFLRCVSVGVMGRVLEPTPATYGWVPCSRVLRGCSLQTELPPTLGGCLLVRIRKAKLKIKASVAPESRQPATRGRRSRRDFVSGP